MSLIGAIIAPVFPPQNSGGNGSQGETDTSNNNSGATGGTSETGQGSGSTGASDTANNSSNTGDSNDGGSNNSSGTGQTETVSPSEGSNTSSQETSSSPAYNAYVAEKAASSNTKSHENIQGISSTRKYESADVSLSETQYRAAAEATAKSVSFEAMLFESLFSSGNGLEPVSYASISLTDTETNFLLSLYETTKLTPSSELTLDKVA